ncbi:MAG: hypothetical protein IIB94_01275 [Candidatus Marinimicrobia bacterium]|nr:hypothetical protein [Candidatus Neomarinimicrobiota bacterium]
MTNIFAGLKIYEIVMMVSGVLLFITTLTALVYSQFKNKPILRLIPFFIISIIMIGFPAYRSIKFGNFSVEMAENLSRFKADTSDTAAYKELVNSVMRFDEFQNIGPSELTMFAEVSAITGDTNRAVLLLDSALRYEPTFKDAMILRSAYLPFIIPLRDNEDNIKNLRENELREAIKEPEQGEFIKL